MKLRSWFTAAALGVACTLGVSGPAAADDAGSEIPNCLQGHGGVGPAYGGGTYTGSGDWYAYSVLLVTPSNSSCEDIQIKYHYPASYWMKYRIRFYPSSGGSYVNSWKYAPSCYPGSGQCSLWILATNVANGTYFRVEGVDQVPNCTPECTQYAVDQPFLLVW